MKTSLLYIFKAQSKWKWARLNFLKNNNNYFSLVLLKTVLKNGFLEHFPFFFFPRWSLLEHQNSNPLAHCTIPLIQIYMGLLCSLAPLPRANTALPRLFYLLRIYPVKGQGLHPYLFQRRTFTYNVYGRFLFCPSSTAWRSICSLHLVQHILQVDIPG